ncbi:MAG: hypothetical protein AAF492_14780, partial [Verrucomicrobiota bacterium]
MLLSLVLQAPAAQIIWVSANTDDAGGASPDDAGWTDLLTAAGHTVDRRVIHDLDVNDAAYADLNAADLVILSRDTSSSEFSSNQREIERWNCIGAPLISMSAYLSRSTVWKWSSGVQTGVSTSQVLQAVAPEHIIFEGIPLDGSDRIGILTSNADVLQNGSGGNGTKLATRAGNQAHWITYWAPGEEFYAGSGQFAGGPRLFFAAGFSLNPQTGELNFTPDGQQLFLNAVNYMAAQGGAGTTVTFSGYTKPETLQAIPLLVSLHEGLPDFTYADFASPNGYDLRVWDSSFSQTLNYEIDTWNTNGTSHVWVQVPALSGPDTRIHLTWGGPTHTNPPVYTTDGSTWSNGFEAVWHMNELDALDSSGHGRDGTAFGNPQVVNGLIGSAVDFDGGADRIQIVGYKGVLAQTGRTVTAWIRTADNNGSIVYWGDNTEPAGAKWQLRTQRETSPEGRLRVEVRAGNKVHQTVMTNNLWHHGVVTWELYDGPAPPNHDDSITNAHIYTDGIISVNTPGWTNRQPMYTRSGDDLLIGADDQFAVTQRELNGELDEIRVASVARSSNWVWAVYMNGSSNAVFNTYAPLELRPPLVLVNEGATNIGTNSATILGRVTGEFTDLTVFAYWGAT